MNYGIAQCPGEMLCRRNSVHTNFTKTVKKDIKDLDFCFQQQRWGYKAI